MQGEAITTISSREILETNEAFVARMRTVPAVTRHQQQLRGCVVPITEMSDATYDPDWRDKLAAELRD